MTRTALKLALPKLARRFVLGGIASAAVLFAAEQAPGEQILRSTSRLVQLSEVVHDAKGAAVRDLTRDDFIVMDQGKERRIAVFQIAEGQAASSTPPSSHPLTLNNRSMAKTERSTAATIILFDALNMRSPKDALYVKRELPKFLKNLQPGDPVAIYSGRINGQGASRFQRRHAIVDSFRGKGSGLVGHWLSSVADRSDSLSSDNHLRVELALAALESIAQHVAAVPGRKTLVWISSAFPITLGFDGTESLAGGGPVTRTGGVSTGAAVKGDLEPFFDRLKRLARVFNNIDLAVYPVDPSGLMIDKTYESAVSGGAEAARIQRSFREVSLDHPEWLKTVGQITAGEIATMDLVASETGGRAFYNANALGESIQWAG